MNGKALWALGLTAGAGALVLRALKRHSTLAGKVVLITGGSRGLGLELARRCLARGAKVALLARDPQTLARASHALGGRVMTFACDVSDNDAVRAAAETVSNRYGGIDVLMHVAGQIAVGPARTMDMADYHAAMNTHLFGAVHAVNAVLPQMRQRKTGRIVLVSSVGGKIALPHLLPYSASKFALVGYGEALHAELANDGIHVTTVVPGLMRTGSPRNATFKGQHQKEYAWFTLADSLPFISMNAERAARRIVAACEWGRAELMMMPLGKLLLLLQSLAPEAFASAMSLVNRALPRSDGAGTEAYVGAQSESALSRSSLTVLTQRAEERNNQRPAHATK